MDSNAMHPHGLALWAYFRGEETAQLVIRRHDGVEVPVPASYFFRAPTEFSPIEHAALESCRGHVLDIGAGSGLHSLPLQSRGMSVTAIDISDHAVDIMKQRSIQDARQADILEYHGGPFDTLLMLGHGIGIVETLPGLDCFLNHAQQLIRSTGQLLVHSLDVRVTDDPVHLAYHEANRRAGRYIGEIRLQFEFEGQHGPYCGWLHVDPETLRRHAKSAKWDYETVLALDTGDYLARLTPLRVI